MAEVTVEQLYEAAQQLPPGDRRSLADRLLRTSWEASRAPSEPTTEEPTERQLMANARKAMRMALRNDRSPKRRAEAQERMQEVREQLANTEPHFPTLEAAMSWSRGYNWDPDG
ncbi:MAG: hypothetical protein COZ06_17230 [Armatimonadetes bacterium CG_4_10_14_3_um_filter_66_18]|nr:hypothetical protein [Armatimonadota bacterium]OIO92563.1 MAG: hypothetical protein AUJ96_32135 [Armatimonadetes bacterium CG2_30_66_41]PIX44635.1 MAG: hypothetical protein COZ57_17125 [Armatimonadetes bacterium CG_4_8_14_3_um_filter_66_20]PIY48121.1 MAG: hypothetical protein COZ06_17230 [Armatimonadetes bacterium CG_4_10_14_3_um_filter_66_18]PIZ32055.1 MAG: hypothetical protein COY42_31890 [Armatimonadetes bacterium CG_4_10_14_0_8_um_filter_66_14]PJB60554.1 MAG: hypothetical protein CO096_